MLKGCIKKTCTLFLWMIAGLILSTFMYSLILQIYELLYKNMPDIFPLYNPVSGKGKYERLSLIMYVSAVFAAMLISVCLNLRYDNSRFEFIITKTDGFYKINAVLPTYVCKFAIQDIVSSMVNGLLFSVSISLIPSQFFSTGNPISDFAEPLWRITDSLGAKSSAAYLTAAVLFSHILSTVPVLKYYRAKWLTGFAEGSI